MFLSFRPRVSARESLVRWELRLTAQDRSSFEVDLEFQNLKQEIQRISEVTNFNGKNLLNGAEFEPLDLQVGVGNDPFQDRLQFDRSASATSLESLQLQELSVAEKETARQGLQSIDSAINRVNGNRAVLGALQNRLQSTINNLKQTDESMSAANSRIRDADIAEETATLTKAQILQNSGVSVLGQANNNASIAVQLIG